MLFRSPNYYGICSGIREIAGICHEHGAKLIVDQAHGAHLEFMQKELSAESQGADIVIGSTHKTLCSFTQSALMNVMTDGINMEELEENLGKVESTSPSYLLMAGMDINADILERHGRRLFGEWNDNLDYFYAEVKKVQGLKTVCDNMLDRTKINIDMSGRGYNGYDLENALIKNGIYPELVTGDILMCMTGIGNRRKDYEKLIKTLKELPSRTDAAATFEEGISFWGRAGERSMNLQKECCDTAKWDISRSRELAQHDIPT